MAAKHFRKKPVVIEAVQWNGTNVLEVYTFMHGAPKLDSAVSQDKWFDFENIHSGKDWHIMTLEDGPNGEAKHVASVGDWIIKGIQGEFYPCKPHIFAATYEPEENLSPQPNVAGEPVAWTSVAQLRLLREQPSHNHRMWGEPLPYHDDIPLYLHPPERAFEADNERLRNAMETPSPSTNVNVEDVREQKLATIVAPDNGTPDEVLSYVLECAKAWVPEARIIGNARAGDIARAIEALPSPQKHVNVPASMLEDGSPLVTDLIREFERARRQWDEFQKTGVSTAAVGSYDLCFSPILKKHLTVEAQDTPAVERLRRALNGAHPNHKTMCVFVEDVRALLNPSPSTNVVSNLADRLRYAADGMDMAVHGEKYGDTTYLDVWRDKPHRVVFEATKLLREAAAALTTEGNANG